MGKNTKVKVEKKKHSYVCGYCKQPDHNRTTCPIRVEHQNLMFQQAGALKADNRRLLNTIADLEAQLAELQQEKDKEVAELRQTNAALQKSVKGYRQSLAILHQQKNTHDPKHKTQLCKYYPNCMNGANCSFAHGTDDLRKFKPPK